MVILWKKIKTKLIIGVLFILLSVATFGLINCSLGFMEYGMRMKDYYQSELYKKDLCSHISVIQRWLVTYPNRHFYSGENWMGEREELFEKIKRQLILNNTNIEFWATRYKDNEILTNLKQGEELSEAQVEAYFKQKKSYSKANGWFILETDGKKQDENIPYFRYGVNYLMIEIPPEDAKNYVVYIGLKEPLIIKDAFYYNSQFYEEKNNKVKNYYIWLGVVGLLLLGAGVCVFLLYNGQKKGAGEEETEKKERKALPLGGIVGGGLLIFSGIIHLYMRWKWVYYWQGTWLPAELEKGYEVENLSLLGICGLGILSGLVLINLLYHCVLEGKILQKTLCYKIFCSKSSKEFFKRYSLKNLGSTLKCSMSEYLRQEKNYFMVVLGVILIVVAIKGVALYTFYYDYDYNWGYLPLVIVGILEGLTFLIIIKTVADYSKAMGVARKIERGELKTQLRLKFSLPALKELGYCLEHIGDGLEHAKEESIKNERLKTELITNVSHDLKTPLTSIISYIDLLKEEEVESEIAKGYIAILDERSNRLKQLVEDLVEASKAMTGNVKAELEKIQFHQLVEQAVGEYSDRLAQNHLEVIIHQLDEIYIEADGRHLWRIIENLLSIVIKYALSHTRVYIDVFQKEEKAQLIIRNTSRDYLDISPEELFGRFTRGDTARSTEGSGLGLAIAQSLATLQGGGLEIIIDGDLFKVILSFPLLK